MRWGLLLLALTGCGFGPAHCQLRIHPGDPSVVLDQQAVEYDTALAQDILDRRHLVPADKFCAAFWFVDIAVRPEFHSWIYPGGMSVSGLTTQTENVFITRDGTALLHELLHIWDDEHFAFGTANHTGWDTNGYYAADDEYTGDARPVGGLK